MMGLDGSRVDRYRRGTQIRRMLAAWCWRERHPERQEARERWAWDALELDRVSWKWPR